MRKIRLQIAVTLFILGTAMPQSAGQPLRLRSVPAPFGDDIAGCQTNAECALFEAAKNGDQRLVKSLLAAGLNINATNRFGNTSLMIAADNEQVEMVKLLTSTGAFVDVRNDFGFTALMFAADKGNEDIITILIQNGAEANAANKVGFTPLYMLLRHICESESSCDRLARLAELLLDRGADANASTDDQETLLMAAASLGNTKAVRILVNRGAYLNRQNSNGETALMLAMREGYVDTAAFLKSVGGR